ncbi:MAG: hypothetical protein WD749_05760 [Phycisphaerales bacterium]
MNNLLKVMFAALSLIAPLGCTSVQVEPIPGMAVTPNPRGGPNVPVYQVGIQQPTRAGIPFAKLTNRLGSDVGAETTLFAFGSKGSELGADFVVVIDAQAYNAGSITTYYGMGISGTQPVNQTAYTALACMYAPVRLGINLDNDSKLSDIQPGSCFEGTPARIGDRLLSIGGYRTTSDRFALYRALAEGRPGQSMEVELVDGGQNVKRITVYPRAND